MSTKGKDAVLFPGKAKESKSEKPKAVKESILLLN